MGAILKVWDGDLRRHLAMKVVLGTGSSANPGETPAVDQKQIARFLEEAQVTGQLDHPGIVPVHELGLDADGRVYFTMKLVKGRDLKRIFDLVFEEQEGWNETRALGVIQKVCDAMAYAHVKGVIHRDLKPANVMVGNFGEVFVMDWGLARVLGRSDSHDLRIRPEYSASFKSVKHRPSPRGPRFSAHPGAMSESPGTFRRERAGGGGNSARPGREGAMPTTCSHSRCRAAGNQTDPAHCSVSSSRVRLHHFLHCGSSTGRARGHLRKGDGANPRALRRPLRWPRSARLPRASRRARARNRRVGGNPQWMQRNKPWRPARWSSLPSQLTHDQRSGARTRSPSMPRIRRALHGSTRHDNEAGADREPEGQRCCPCPQSKS
jgi:hypothetical protein